MVYKVRQEKAEELKDNRKQIYFADVMGRSYTSIATILTGFRCPELVAKAFISIKERVPIDDKKMEEYLDYYFEKIYEENEN